MRINVVETPELGNRSYVIDDGSVSVVIDPQRDLDRIEQVIEHDVEYVVETHIHNDYVTGGFELARRTGATYALNEADPVRFERLGLIDGTVLRAGNLDITALATPGHTDTHLSYVVRDLADPLSPPALFSGGSLLFATVGRTDLVSPDRTEELARAQWRSARRLAQLPTDTDLFPTHGFGSFCAASRTESATTGTIGDELHRNVALTTSDEDAFVIDLIASLTAYPSYYPQMAPINLAGPDAGDLDSTFANLAGAELTQRLLAGARVVDLRPAAEYAAAHLTGSISIALGAQFATYVGWLNDWDAPITVIGPRIADLIAARRQLIRIGIEPDGWAWGSLTDLADVPTTSFGRVGWDRFAPGPNDTVLDVRRDDEYAAGHLADALHIPLHQVEERLAELPRARTWVYCQSGFRAGTATSILSAHGFEAIWIEADFSDAAGLGLTA